MKCWEYIILSMKKWCVMIPSYLPGHLHNTTEGYYQCLSENMIKIILIHVATSILLCHATFIYTPGLPHNAENFT